VTTINHSVHIPQKCTTICLKRRKAHTFKCTCMLTKPSYSFSYEDLTQSLMCYCQQNRNKIRLYNYALISDNVVSSYRIQYTSSTILKPSPRASMNNTILPDYKWEVKQW